MNQIMIILINIWRYKPDIKPPNLELTMHGESNKNHDA